MGELLSISLRPGPDGFRAPIANGVVVAGNATFVRIVENGMLRAIRFDDIESIQNHGSAPLPIDADARSAIERAAPGAQLALGHNQVINEPVIVATNDNDVRYFHLSGEPVDILTAGGGGPSGADKAGAKMAAQQAGKGSSGLGADRSVTVSIGNKRSDSAQMAKKKKNRGAGRRKEAAKPATSTSAEAPTPLVVAPEVKAVTGKLRARTDEATVAANTATVVGREVVVVVPADGNVTIVQAGGEGRGWQRLTDSLNDAPPKTIIGDLKPWHALQPETIIQVNVSESAQVDWDAVRALRGRSQITADQLRVAVELGTVCVELRQFAGGFQARVVRVGESPDRIAFLPPTMDAKMNLPVEDRLALHNDHLRAVFPASNMGLPPRLVGEDSTVELLKNSANRHLRLKVVACDGTLPLQAGADVTAETLMGMLVGNQPAPIARVRGSGDHIEVMIARGGEKMVAPEWPGAKTHSWGSDFAGAAAHRAKKITSGAEIFLNFSGRSTEETIWIEWSSDIESSNRLRSEMGRIADVPTAGPLPRRITVAQLFEVMGPLPFVAKISDEGGSLRACVSDDLKTLRHMFFPKPDTKAFPDARPTQFEPAAPTQFEPTRQTQVELSRATQPDATRTTQGESSRPTQVEPIRPAQTSTGANDWRSKVGNRKNDQTAATGFGEAILVEHAGGRVEGRLIGEVVAGQVFPGFGVVPGDGLLLLTSQSRELVFVAGQGIEAVSPSTKSPKSFGNEWPTKVELLPGFAAIEGAQRMALARAAAAAPQIDFVGLVQRHGISQAVEIAELEIKASGAGVAACRSKYPRFVETEAPNPQ